MVNDGVIRTAFMISFFGHCLFLGLPGNNLNNANLNRQEDITFKIEVEKPPLLPKVDIMGEEKKLKEIMEKPEPVEPETELLSEETMVEEAIKESVEENIEVVDSAQEAMLRYQDMVKQKIEEVRRYPSWAKRQGIEGIVGLRFIVSSCGLSQDVEIICPSGSKILDEEAIATIRRANPFPPLPEEICSSLVKMEIYLVFTLE